MDEENGKKGFAGLSSLTSKLEKQTQTSTPVRLPAGEQGPEEKAPGKSPVAPRPSTSQTSKAAPPKPSSKGSGSSGWGWFLGIAAVIIVVVMYSSNQANKPNTPLHSYTPTIGTPGSGSSEAVAPSSKPAIPPVVKPIPKSIQRDITFQKPPVGRDQVLSMAEIRWCLREDMSADAQRPLIKTNAEVYSFNQSVNDRNRRCGSFRYRRSNLELAKRQVEELRPKIEREARLKFLPAAPYSDKKGPSASEVREVQGLLSNLGYDPGPIDGQLGRRTVKAIEESQRKSGQTIDGQIDEELLSALRAAQGSARSTPRPPNRDFSVSESQFFVGLMDTQGKLEVYASTQVPFDSKNSCYGWQVKLSGVSGAIESREILRMPSKPMGGWPVATDGSSKITPSLDQKSAMTDATLEITDGWVSNMWCVADGDPLGSYSIDVILNGRFIETFKFDVVKAQF